MIALFLLALQVASNVPADAPPPPEKISILVNAAPPCRRAPGSLDDGSDIVVCAPSDQQQRLPLRDERGVPDGPAPSNPYLSGGGALASSAEPCAIHGCMVGFGGPVVAAAAKGAIALVKQALAKKVDKEGRVPIDLSDPVPQDVSAKVLP